MVDSANGAALIWSPIGNPPLVKPHGSVIAGIPYTSNAPGLLRFPPAGFPRPLACGFGAGGASVAAMVAGGPFIVGVIKRSTVLNVFLISLRTRSTCRRASAYTSCFALL